MAHRECLAACLVLLVAVASVPGPSSGTAHFDVSVSPSLDVPDRLATFDGRDHTLAELGRVDRGEPIEATADVDDDTGARLLLFDEDHDVVGEDEGTGAGEHVFPTGDRAPGTYVVGLRVDGTIVDVEPVVVSAYDVSADSPDRATAGSAIGVTADLTAVEAEEAPHRVQVVIGDERERLRTTLSPDPGSGMTYSGSVDTGSLSPGTYDLYVVALGIEEAFDDQKVVVGASDVRSIRIADSTKTEDESDGGGGGGSVDGGGGGSSGGSGADGALGGGDGDGAGAVEGGEGGEDEPRSTAPPSQTGSLAQTTAAGSTRSTAAPPGTTPSSSTPDGTAGTDTTATRPATERTPTSTAATTSTPGQALGAWLAVVGIIVAVLVAIRRD